MLLKYLLKLNEYITTNNHGQIKKLIENVNFTLSDMKSIIKRTPEKLNAAALLIKAPTLPGS